MERGFLSRELAKRTTKKPVCTAGTFEFGNIGLIECYFILMMLAAGIALAIFIFLVEMLYYRISKRETQNNQLFHYLQTKFTVELTDDGLE